MRVEPFVRERSREVGPRVPRILYGHLKAGKSVEEATEGRRREAQVGSGDQGLDKCCL